MCKWKYSSYKNVDNLISSTIRPLIYLSSTIRLEAHEKSNSMLTKASHDHLPKRPNAVRLTPSAARIKEAHQRYVTVLDKDLVAVALGFRHAALLPLLDLWSVTRLVRVVAKATVDVLPLRPLVHLVVGLLRIMYTKIQNIPKLQKIQNANYGFYIKYKINI